MRRASISLPTTLLIGAAVIALVVVGAWWAVPSRAELSAAASRLAAVPPGWLVLAGVLALAPTAVEAVRVWLVARGFVFRYQFKFVHTISYTTVFPSVRWA